MTKGLFMRPPPQDSRRKHRHREQEPGEAEDCDLRHQDRHRHEHLGHNQVDERGQDLGQGEAVQEPGDHRKDQGRQHVDPHEEPVGWDRHHEAQVAREQEGEQEGDRVRYQGLLMRSPPQDSQDQDVNGKPGTRRGGRHGPESRQQRAPPGSWQQSR